MEFVNGYYYDSEIKRLRQHQKNKNILIELTKTENKVIELMVEKAPLVKIEDFENIIWKGKAFSKDTLRNMISKIRLKTCYELIRNHSSVGYSLNTEL